MRSRTIIVAVFAMVVAGAAGLVATQWLAPGSIGPTPKLTPPPPLPAVVRNSTVVVPITIPLTVMHDAVERGAPRTFAGKAPNPAEQILQNADINWTAARGPISVTGADNVLSLATPLTGTVNVKGSLSADLQNAIGDTLGKLFGGNVAKQVGSINIKQVNANADLAGNVAMSARPSLTPDWHIEPNLTAQVNLSDTNISAGGMRFNVPAQVKPVIDKAVNEQLAAVQQRLRNDPAIEKNARIQWALLCRSVPLQATIAGMPPLWLELRPVKAIAAQPRIDASAMTLTLGVRAETRITPAQTKPECPFPANLEITPATPGRLDVGIPVDLPFTEINKIVDAQLTGKTFPEDGSGPVAVTVKRATVAASGDRLLISLLVDGKDKASWFGFSGEATVHIWGRPVLDPAQQVLRLADVELAVESQTALIGTAARAAAPYLQKALAERMVIDLKPFAADAQQKIAALLTEFRKSDNGVRTDAVITGVRLAGIAFDAATLRVIAEADGTINVSVTSLPGL